MSLGLRVDLTIAAAGPAGRIADKVRGNTMPLGADCRSGPCPRFARRARSYRGMVRVGGCVGADLIRESRRGVRLSRTRSAPWKRHASRWIGRALPAIRAQGALLQGNGAGGGQRSGSHPRIAPEVPAIADKVRSYGETPCLPADCRSGPCPRFARRARSYRGMAWVGQRRSGSHPRIAPEVPAIADKVRSYGEMPCLTGRIVGTGPARDSRAGRAPTGNGAGGAA